MKRLPTLFKQPFKMAFLLIFGGFFLACEPDLSEEKIEELSNTFLTNCDKIEQNLKQFQKGLPGSNKEEVLENWDQSISELENAVYQNRIIADQINAEPFNDFFAYVMSITSELKSAKQVYKIETEAEQQPVVSERKILQFYHYMDQLRPYYFRIMQKIS